LEVILLISVGNFVRIWAGNLRVVSWNSTEGSFGAFIDPWVALQFLVGTQEQLSLEAKSIVLNNIIFGVSFVFKLKVIFLVSVGNFVRRWAGNLRVVSWNSLEVSFRAFIDPWVSSQFFSGYETEEGKNNNG
jgi:hypothetical protein